MGKKNKDISMKPKCTAVNALRYGSLAVRLSAAIFGFGCFAKSQIIKGLFYLLAEAFLIFYLIQSGAANIARMITLGDQAQQKVWNEAKNIYEYVDGDRSLIILLYGIVTLFIVVLFFCLLVSSLKSAYKVQLFVKEGKPVPSFTDEIKALLDKKLHISLLTLPTAGVLMFTVLPLVFMISMAFTDYSKEGNKLVLFDWVGLINFKKILDLGGSLGQTFWPVLGWTLIWAIAATFTNYFLGMFLALLINWKEIRIKKFWRFCFVLTVAIPHFVTLLIIQQMLQPEGAVNILLRNMGIIGAKASLPFFTDALWARITVIIINLWVGVPYTLLQTTGILNNIPQELYDSAKVDGAGPIITFRKITLPYMLFITTPYLITAFAGNINNFNVIFLTSQGYPRDVGSTAGKTDLLITWLYKLTIENQYFNVGAVIGIMTFITLAIISLVTFRYSGSNKNEEEFR